MRLRLMLGCAVTALAPIAVAHAADAPLRPDQVEYRTLYKDMVETDTSITTGSCTVLADKIEAHMKARGFTDPEIFRFAVPDHPKEGGIVVTYAGTSKTVKPTNVCCRM